MKNYINQTEYLIDENLFLRIGSSWALDTIYIAIIAPLGFIGFLLNLVCFWTFHNIKIRQKGIKFYKYMKIYSLAAAVTSLILGFSFMSFSPRYFIDFIHPIVKFFRCRIIAYPMITLFFFLNLLDILISIDRMSIFTAKLKRFESINPFNLSLFILIICFIINSPVIFSYEILSDKIFLTTNINNHCGLTEFGLSKIGIISNLLGILIRDFITFILEFVASLFVVYFYRTYKNNPNLLNNILVNDIQTINDNRTSRIHNIESKINYRQRNYKKLLLMTLVLLILSIITHFITAFVFFSALKLMSDNIFVHYLIVCLGFLAFAFKNFLNIIVFYFFNSNFKKQLKKSIDFFFLTQ